MNKNLLTVCCLLATHLSQSQSSTEEFTTLKKKADSLYEVKDFENSALAYVSLIKLADKTVINNMRWNAACSWTLSHHPDNAFAELNSISNSGKLALEYVEDLITDSDFDLLHNDKRWEKVADECFTNAAKAYFEEMEKKNYVLTPPEQLNAAITWTIMKNKDSAFAYLDKIANVKDNVSFISFQTINGLSNLHTDKRWLPAINAIYRNVATTFSSRIRSGNWTNPTLDGYDAARAWALANETDSAFYYLDKIVNTDYNIYSDFKQISNAGAFEKLKSDKRWLPLIEKVKKHVKPDPCAHSFNGPDIPMVFTIDPSSIFLKSDDKGSYLNGVDKVKSLEQHAYNFLVSGNNRVMISYNKNVLSARSMSLDLSQPVPGSGSVVKGVITDRDASFHIFYKIDAAVTPMLIYNIREMAIGSSFESPRTEIVVHINGDLNTLVMGTWGLGDCNEPYAYGGHINGHGSTLVKITRSSESDYTIEAPEGSIGRLWNNQNMTMPVDMGLFRTGFIIHLKKQ